MSVRARLLRWDTAALPVLAAALPASGGRLGTGRRVGWIGVAVAVLVAAAGVGTAAASGSAEGPRTVAATAGLPCGLAGAVQGTAYIGPPPGSSLSGYARARQRVLAACAAAAPTRSGLAVVSLRAGQPPAGLGAALTATVIDRVYLQVPGHRARYVDTSGAGGLGQGLARLVALLQGRHPAEATSVRGGCRCLYAAVVTGSLQTLLQVSSRSAVRLVDLAPVGTRLAAATVWPLAPDDAVAASRSVPEAAP